jgi:RNA polymerase sigma-70 factor (ECF subfamily)
LEANDLILVGSGAQADDQAFEKLFIDWYGPLHGYASSVLRDENQAEEAVQAVFCRLLERWGQLRIQTSMKAYLYGCVYHECVTWMRREKSRRAFRTGVLAWLGMTGGGAAGRASDKAGRASDNVEARELEQRFERALDKLPKQCRAIFQLSRFSGLKYREIAEQLGISVKTVETQMAKALRHLRRQLADFLE